MTIENELATDVAGTDSADLNNSTDTGAVDAGESGATTSMEDTIKAAVAAQQTRTQSGAVTGEDGTETGEQAGRQRGPDGKFLPKASGTAPQQAEGEQTVETAEQPVAAKPHDVAPNTWRKEIAADFAKLPENVREEIHKREQDFHRGIGQYREAAGFGQQLAQEMLPFQEQIRAANIHPRDVVKNLLPAWNTLANGTPQDKANLILQLVKDYGIDFTSLGTDPQPGTAQTTQVHPEVAALKRELGEIKGTLTAQERQRAEAEYQSNVEMVNKFGSDPAHEHFNSVRETMAGLIKSGQATDLQDAYDKAIWINPEVRKSLLAKQEKERADKVAAEAAAARRAAGANVIRRGTPPVKQTPGDMTDTIRATAQKLGYA